jgi:lipopolysaccharide biosynthesis regulator YciM
MLLHASAMMAHLPLLLLLLLLLLLAAAGMVVVWQEMQRYPTSRREREHAILSYCYYRSLGLLLERQNNSNAVMMMEGGEGSYWRWTWLPLGRR